MHRISEVFGEKAILKGDMELRLYSGVRYTNDLDYVFVPFNSKGEIEPLLDAIMDEIPSATIEKRMHSKTLRYKIVCKDLAVQLEAGVANECPSVPVATTVLARKENLLPRVITTMRLDIALSHKLAAWNERRLVRDLYDVYFIFSVLGERPHRDTLLKRLGKVSSRLPLLRNTRRMTLDDFCQQLQVVAGELDMEMLEPLEAIIDQDELSGLAKRIRASLLGVIDYLKSR